MKRIIAVALFRGINVGGRHAVKMGELSEVLTSLGASAVRTYIQSGNVVFACSSENFSELGERISAAVLSKKGFSPEVLLLTSDVYMMIVSENPFADRCDDPKHCHFFFLAEKAASPNLALLESLVDSSESYHITERCFYLFAPKGIGRSKLAAAVERAMGVAVTARNLRTVLAVLELVRG